MRLLEDGEDGRQHAGGAAAEDQQADHGVHGQGQRHGNSDRDLSRRGTNKPLVSYHITVDLSSISRMIILTICYSTLVFRIDSFYSVHNYPNYFQLGSY